MMDSLQLYVHIPFCTSKCDYCDFLSAPADEYIRKRYIESLLNEISGYENKFDNYQVDTIFLGGGTPSILSGETILRIFDAIYTIFDVSSNAEITMEVNPESVKEEDIIYWKKAGINRISIGLQSANDQELRVLGRKHNYNEFLYNYNVIRNNGFTNINVDLISGIPGQTIDSYKNTLDSVIKQRPEHISAYSLIVEEGTPFWDRYGKAALPVHDDEIVPLVCSEELDRQMYEYTKSVLGEAGYRRYEVSNYSIWGYECRHNIGYWDRVNYLGIGLGASSLINRVRYKNVSDIDKYIGLFVGIENCENNLYSCGSVDGLIYDKANKLVKPHAADEIIELSIKDEIEEFMFLGLRKIKGISRIDFQSQFGKSIDCVYGDVLVKLNDDKLVKQSGDYICLTDKGLDLSNYVFSKFLLS